MPPRKIDRLLSVKEAAARLGASIRTVYRRLKDGSLPSTKIGGLRRILESDLEEFIRSRRT